jgi:hypothetical protein
MDESLTKNDVAALLRLSVQTLARWRCLGIGPRYIKLGPGRTSPIRYSRAAVEAYLAASSRRSTADRGDEA